MKLKISIVPGKGLAAGLAPVFLVLAPAVSAQDTSAPEELILEGSTHTAEARASEDRASLTDLRQVSVRSPAAVETVAATESLQAVAPFADNAAGMCEVVNGFLGDFCASNPDDAGCMALLQ